MASPSMLYVAGGGIAVVSTQSTAVPLSTTAIACNMIQIQGVSTNSSILVAANSSARLAVASRVGIPVAAGTTSMSVAIWATDVSQVYIDGISTESVSYIYYRMGSQS